MIVDFFMSFLHADDTTTYTCTYDIVELSCPADGLVFIVTASYGQYATTCDDDDACCAPDVANDCTETLEQYNEEAWVDLKLACNYNSQCVFQHNIHSLTSCPQQPIADYMTVTYVCSNGKAVSSSSHLLPKVFTRTTTKQRVDKNNSRVTMKDSTVLTLVDAETEPTPDVGFSAYATTTRSYSVNDTIEFDGVHTNLGSHYDNNSTFTCPVNGTYFFTFSVMSGGSDVIAAALEIDNARLATAYADDVGSHYSHATNSALIRCNDGQNVFVKCIVNGSLYSTTSNKHSTFSGFLL